MHCQAMVRVHVGVPLANQIRHVPLNPESHRESYGSGVVDSFIRRVAHRVPCGCILSPVPCQTVDGYIHIKGVTGSSENANLKLGQSYDRLRRNLGKVELYQAAGYLVRIAPT